ncbi:MAG: ABC transporter ATP-binding protein [Erysipelotrichaceae bacterium]|nr:ABC transporter ATP-binding protein [Erysipelotrichaceae bacterium]
MSIPKKPRELKFKEFTRWANVMTKGKKGSFFLLTFLHVATAVIAVFNTWIFKRLVDAATSGNVERFGFYAILFLGFTLTMIAFRAVIRYLTARAKTVLENAFRADQLKLVLSKDYSEVTSLHTGDWLTRLDSDCSTIADGMVSIVPNVSGLTVRIIGSTVLIIRLLPNLDYKVFLLIIGLFIFTYFFRVKLKSLHKEIQKTKARLQAYLLERISALMIIHSYSREKDTMDGADEKMTDYYKSVIRRNNYANITSTGFSLVMDGLYAGAAVYCGYKIITGELTYGTLAAVLQAINQIRTPISTLSGYFPKYFSMIGSAERLMEAESYKNDNDGEFISPEDIAKIYKESFNKIKFDDVSFRYRPRNKDDKTTKVLDGISFEINKGEFISITGESGVGKSTILKLLMCLYPLDKGTREIVIDNQARPLDSSWRGLFAYVPQQNLLLAGTIREIVTFGDKEKISDEKGILRALEIAGATSFIEKLKDGIDTHLGERGNGLSEGQMQRIAIARAIYSNHPILLFDEATSALDTQTENQLLSNLQQMTDRTVIIVTHRLEVLDICNKELVVTPQRVIVKEINHQQAR